MPTGAAEESSVGRAFDLEGRRELTDRQRRIRAEIGRVRLQAGKTRNPDRGHGVPHANYGSRLKHVGYLRVITEENVCLKSEITEVHRRKQEKTRI